MKLAVLTPDQVKRAEQSAFEAGENALTYMESAAVGIARQIEIFCGRPSRSHTIHLLVGKGNNGGDALAVGGLLLGKGYRVLAYYLRPMGEGSPLLVTMASRFKQAGGTLIPLTPDATFDSGMILDGLFGTGFTGKTEGDLAEIIEGCNASGLPIFSIDIPSGLNGTTGEVVGAAIRAHTTLFLGYPKRGFFLREGWDHVGKLIHVDFGMPEKFIQPIQVDAFLLSQVEAACLLPPVKRSRHKYQAGYILAVGGSPTMPGAALLSCLATLRAGAGITRLFHPPQMRQLLATSPRELIKEEWDLEDATRLVEESKRAKALLIGPGMGRDQRADRARRAVLEQIDIPTVIDADALYHLAGDAQPLLPKDCVLTPHDGEMQRLLGEKTTWESCQAYADAQQVTVILKGGPTLVFSPQKTPTIIPQGDPGMASAGTGDVLTGVVAAQLAQGLSPHDAATLAAVLHGLAGELAARSKTAYGLIASDLIDVLPEAIGRLICASHNTDVLGCHS